MSSKTSVPMEPAPPLSDDLVQRLRAWEVWELDKGAPPPPTSFREAADRIEELEEECALLSKANTHADEGLVQYEKRIEELERAIWQMHSEAHEHIKRVEALEAVLQEIGKTNSYAGILARRVLEGKP